MIRTLDFAERNGMYEHRVFSLSYSNYLSILLAFSNYFIRIINLFYSYLLIVLFKSFAYFLLIKFLCSTIFILVYHRCLRSSFVATLLRRLVDSILVKRQP